MNELGRKFDKGKLMWEIVPFDILDQLVGVMTHGAEKYEADNWKHVELDRYKGALMRHFSAYMQGEAIDKDSGYHHLACVITNAVFLLWKEIHQNGNKKKCKE